MNVHRLLFAKKFNCLDHPVLGIKEHNGKDLMWFACQPKATALMHGLWVREGIDLFRRQSVGWSQAEPMTR